MSDQPEKSQSPSASGGWVVPEHAVTKRDTPGSEPNVAMPDDAEPNRTGGWFVPPEAAGRAAALTTNQTMPEEAPHKAKPATHKHTTHTPAATSPAPSTEVKPEQPTSQEQPAPQVAAQEKPLPQGSALSSEVDYSNYVPGVGFVAKDTAKEGSPTTSDAPVPPVMDVQPPAVVSTDAAASQPANPYIAVVAQPIVTPAPTPVASEPSAPIAPAPAAVATITPPPPPTATVAPLPQPVVTVDQLAAQLAKPQANQSLVQKFTDVERSVHILRRRYTAGALTRDQLQAELRRLMILDDQGHWWMIGVQTDLWYKYDGKDWVQATPPGQSSVPIPTTNPPTSPIGGSAVISPPATINASVSPAVNVSASVPAQSAIPDRFNIPLDEYGMPLPQRVPIDDPGATMVGQSAPRLDQTLKSTEPTTIISAKRPADPAANLGVAPYDGGVTVPSSAVQVTQPSAVVSAATDVIPSPITESARLKPIQPDYGIQPRSALLDRQRRGGCLIRLAIISVFLVLVFSLLAILGSVLFYSSTVNKYDAAITALPVAVNAVSQSVKFFDAGGRMIYQLNDPNFGARVQIPLSEISPYMLHATVATEDKTFFDNPGFDIIGIFRAILQNLRAGSAVSGASTITQQLTRNKILDIGSANDRSSSRKITEILVSSEVARRYTKSEILDDYLNTVYYGNLAYGVEAAAQTYFGKHAKDLNLAEASFLAGLVQGPALYDPATNSDGAIKRAREVRRLMVEKNCIQFEHKPLDTKPTCITQQMMNDNVDTIAQMEATVSTFRPSAQAITYPHFVNYVRQLLEKQYGQDAIYNSGFNVYTTIDPKIQDLAQNSVTSRLAELKGRNVGNGAVFVIRPSDGAILAMVGSADYNNKSISGQFNVVTDGKRQPGSTLKPFIYLTNFERDTDYWTPATVIWDVPTDFNGYRPRNYDGNFHGPQTVRYALASSLNIPAVKALQHAGIEQFIAVAKRLGINLAPAPAGAQDDLTIALGSREVTLFDLVRGYSVFANNGKLIEPFAISKITRREGTNETTVFVQAAPNGTQVAQPELTYLMTNMLSDNNARLLEFPQNNPLNLPGIAAKTGTSNDSKDNWTIGYTPDLVVGVWVGNSDGTPMIGTSGISGAAPIWKDVMIGTYSYLGKQPTPFSVPPNIQHANICADFGTLNFQECKTVRDEAFFTAKPPSPPDSIFKKLQVDSFTNKIANENCKEYVVSRIFINIPDQSALDWLNNDPKGQAFAQAYNLQLPLQQPPTAACDANDAANRPVLKVSSPQSNAVVNGVVVLNGRVDRVPDFHQYQIEVGTGANPADFKVVDGPYPSQQPNEQGFLGRWDTSQVASGDYTIKLAAMTNQGNIAEVRVFVHVNNTGPTVAPTQSPIIITSRPGVTPTVSKFATPTPGGNQPRPTVINPFAPTHTPSPR